MVERRVRGGTLVLAALAWTGPARADEATAQPAPSSATGADSRPSDSDPEEGAPYDGGALPPGFHVERRVSWVPTVLGGAVFSASWIGFALPIDHDPASPLRWIPVGGALAYGATVRPNDDFPRSVIMSICALDTVGQVLGLSLFVVGAFFGPEVIARDAPPVAIGPYLTPREVGIVGRFGP